MTIRVALVGGPMYDHLYDAIPASEVEVVLHADHPTLNRRLAHLLAAGERLDLISTHSKYAPSQAAWLRPLDEVVDPVVVGGLSPRAVELCRFAGKLYCLPRCIDVRVLWVRADRVDPAPDTWADLVSSTASLGFPGRESGLFGTFFEIVTGLGGRIFDDQLQPTMATPDAITAIELLAELASRAPADLPQWHYDDVDAALLSGRVDMAGAWPGGFGAIRDSALAGVLRPYPYLAGPTRRVSYAGCHAWAIPRTCGDLDGALALIARLSSAETHALDATGGTICANETALAAIEPCNELDRERLAITRRMVDEAMITYPSLARFPEIEDAGWSAIRDCLLRVHDPAEAVAVIQAAAETVLGSGGG
ncbi:MAG: extracellular solute-binding protein [Acidimicrobiales bacterium]